MSPKKLQKRIAAIENECSDFLSVFMCFFRTRVYYCKTHTQMSLRRQHESKKIITTQPVHQNEALCISCAFDLLFFNKTVFSYSVLHGQIDFQFFVKSETPQRAKIIKPYEECIRN